MSESPGAENSNPETSDPQNSNPENSGPGAVERGGGEVERGGGEVERFASDGPWEGRVGYSRAVAAGPFVFTAGCTAWVDGSVQNEGDPYGQALTAFRVAEEVLGRAGCTLADVVQTRMYVAHIRDQEHVGRAHLELFADVRPAATMLEVSAFADPRMLVEVEVVAYRASQKHTA